MDSVQLATFQTVIGTGSFEAAARALARDGTRVSIVVNADSLHTWFLPALARVPGPAYELHSDDQDHTADLLRAGTAMAAVTAEQVVVQGCRLEKLGAMRYLAAGAAIDGPMIVYNRKDRLQHRFLASIGRRPDPPIHYVPSASAFIEAIRLGMGWGMVPEQIVRGDATLIPLFPDKFLDVPLYWQYWRLDSAVLGELTAAVREAAAGYLRD